MEQIIISGFGGQGVLSLGLFVAYSAMNMGHNVSWLPSYGPEMRGGTANVSVTYSGGEIACPLISNPDLLVAFNSPSVDKFADKVKSGGTVLINSSIVKRKYERDGIKTIYVPVDEMAARINPKGGNIVTLGVMLSVLGSISKEAAVKAVEYVFREKPKVIEPNLKCLEKGIAFGKEFGL